MDNTTFPSRYSLTTSQVARQLGVSGQWTLRLAQAGKLPHLRTPLGRLYDSEVIDRLAQERAERFANAA
jgi:excisionase family DNA binding protein